VTNGLFTVALNFGSGPFAGADRWLEIGVRSNGLVVYATLTPRQLLRPTPYAMFANVAGTVPNGAMTSVQLAPAAITAANLAPSSVSSAALADWIALGTNTADGQLDIYRTAAGTPGISLFGSSSQISTYGSDGKDQSAFGVRATANSS
jgi:hypothetical protein